MVVKFEVFAAKIEIINICFLFSSISNFISQSILSPHRNFEYPYVMNSSIHQRQEPPRIGISKNHERFQNVGFDMQCNNESTKLKRCSSPMNAVSDKQLLLEQINSKVDMAVLMKDTDLDPVKLLQVIQRKRREEGKIESRKTNSDLTTESTSTTATNKYNNKETTTPTKNHSNNRHLNRYGLTVRENMDLVKKMKHALQQVYQNVNESTSVFKLALAEYAKTQEFPDSFSNLTKDFSNHAVLCCLQDQSVW